MMVMAVLMRYRRTIRAMTVRMVRCRRIIAATTRFVLPVRAIVEVRPGRAQSQPGERAEKKEPLQKPEHHHHQTIRLKTGQGETCKGPAQAFWPVSVEWPVVRNQRLVEEGRLRPVVDERKVLFFSFWPLAPGPSKADRPSESRIANTSCPRRPAAVSSGMDLSDFRKEYSDRGLRRADLNEDPVVQFALWFQQAIDLGVHEPNAMTLATTDERGMPFQRTVLLKSFDHEGFIFFTNYGSRKAAQIAANPRVSLLFPWLILERQVIIQGRAEKISTAESLKYFLSRPRESQIGAWVSNQSEVISSRKFLLQKLTEIRDKFAQGEVPLPSFWGGYRVVPEMIEFWQGGAARLHDRFLYTRAGRDWKIDRLSP